MALSPEYEQLSNTLSLLIQAWDQGVTPDRLGDALKDARVPECEAATWVDLLAILHEEGERQPVVSNPRYRKGTAMQPTTWDSCLWRPTP